MTKQDNDKFDYYAISIVYFLFGLAALAGAFILGNELFHYYHVMKAGNQNFLIVIDLISAIFCLVLGISSILASIKLWPVKKNNPSA